MAFVLRSWMKLSAGAVVVAGIALVFDAATAPVVVGRLDRMAKEVIVREGGADIRADFHTSTGALTRHPTLYGGESVDDGRRVRIARAIAALPGAGGVHWASRGAGPAPGTSETPERGPYHCQRDVESLLAQRVIRFNEGSASITADSATLLDEVADALEPCGGSIIAIAGHSDAVGDAAINLRLSRQRARAVREALVARGLPRDGLRAQGYGSQRPIAGIPPEDSANRRIEFSVIAIEPLQPTPIDTPDAG
ncbi:OmpA family protein [Croceicoccus hydrothermalis]|uniref:OmpA family protein n=1 Tax=Croceicoccus hydrothermalis TaxID=2867964 RepID=UPI001EFB4F08|nr:OmpA family protein [Croceicoccus hydrothermalis]